MNTWQSGHLKHVTHCCACNETICRSSIVLYCFTKHAPQDRKFGPTMNGVAFFLDQNTMSRWRYDVCIYAFSLLEWQSEQKEHHMIASQQIWQVLIRCCNNQLSTWTNLMPATLVSCCLRDSTRIDMFHCSFDEWWSYIAATYKHFDSTFFADKVGGFFWMQRRERMIQAYAEDLSGRWLSLIYIIRDWSGKEEARMRSSIPEMQALRI